MSSIDTDRFLLPAWGVSLALHCAAVALALTFAAQVKPILKEEVFQWEVALVQAMKSDPTPEQSQPVSKPPQPMARLTPAPPIDPASEQMAKEVPPETPQIVQRETPPVIETVKPIEQKVEVLQPKIEPIEQKVVEVVQQKVEPIEQKVEVDQPKVEPVVRAAVETKESEPAVNAEPIIAQNQPVTPAAPTEIAEAQQTPHEPVAHASLGMSPHEVTVPQAAPAPSHPESSQTSAHEAVGVSRPADPAPVDGISPSPSAKEAPEQMAKAVRSGPEPKPDHRWLAESLWRRVAELKRYPSSARLNGLEGKVVLKAIIRSDGHLAELSVQKSSGHTVLDEAAMEAVRLACPLHMKHELGKPQIVVSLPIVYSLAN